MCPCINNIIRLFHRSAPEVILDGHYTHGSDVWAFGILAWELYTSFKAGVDERNVSVPFFELEEHEVNSSTQCIPNNVYNRQRLIIEIYFQVLEDNVLMATATEMRQIVITIF